MKLGVILSGGGAKGAYEAGFLKALAEFNIVPHAVAGTSIGALNGAIYCANLDQGAKFSANLVENIWHKMAQDEVFKFDKANVTLNIMEVITYFTPIAPLSIIGRSLMALGSFGTGSGGAYKTDPAKDILKKDAPIHKLRSAVPFYVALCKSSGNLLDTLKFLQLKSGQIDYFKIQDLKDKDIYSAILASAALPILFKANKINGIKYRDGCLGEQESEFGNVPAIPLVKDEKCTHLIVCHLNEGSFFNRYDPIFENTNIIEIRPKNGTFNSVLDPLKFNVDKIDLWINQGYEDSKKILSECFEALHLKQKRATSEMRSDEAIRNLLNRDFKLFD